MRLALLTAAALACLTATVDTIQAQTSEKQRTTLTDRDKYRERLNENVIYLMGGQLGAAYVVIAHDISVVASDGDNLRVLPVIGGAAVQNLRDVVFLRGIDLGITNLLTLNELKATGELGANLDRQVAYITSLFPEALQVLARPGIERIEDLKGKKVGFNNKGSGTAQFAPVVFKTLGIEVQDLYMTQADAIEKMRSGELDATVCTCPIPIPTFPNVKSEWGFKLLPVPYAPALEENYYPARISAEDYPNLLPAGASIDTIATSSVLVAFNWPRGSIRYNRIAKFVDAMFSKFEDFRKPPRHPFWRTVNLAATVRGWQRFPAAQEWIDNPKREDPAALRASFTRFVGGKQGADRPSPAAGDSGSVAQERLFQEFLEWARTNRR